ncbi:hypothetical protein C8R45DRAFT_509668 [Mycena sanguinolenta]|nr:hypothetical protein C8R45DRAFT_509668 [Mycena sanguinolenta]
MSSDRNLGPARRATIPFAVVLALASALGCGTTIPSMRAFAGPRWQRAESESRRRANANVGCAPRRQGELISRSGDPYCACRFRSVLVRCACGRGVVSRMRMRMRCDSTSSVHILRHRPRCEIWKIVHEPSSSRQRIMESTLRRPWRRKRLTIAAFPASRAWSGG